MEASRARNASFGRRRTLFGGGGAPQSPSADRLPIPPHRYITEYKHETGDFRWFRVRGHLLNFMQASLVADGRNPMGS